MKRALWMVLGISLLMVTPSIAATIDLSWPAPAVTPTHDAATGYRLFKGTTAAVCSGTPPLSTVLTNVTTLTFADLNVPAGAVCYEVAGTNAGGEGLRSNRITLTVPVNPPGATTLNAVIR